MMFDEFHFIRPVWLIGLLITPLIFLLLRTQGDTQSDWRRICDPSLLQYLMPESQAQKKRWLCYAVPIIFGIAVIALAGPAWEQREVPALTPQHASVILLDLSKSMDAQDIKPSRLERAKLKAIDFLRYQDEGLSGVVVFAGDAHTVAPLTSDKETLLNLVPTLSTSLMPVQGSALDEGLTLARTLIENANIGQGHIIVITDSFTPAAVAVTHASRSKNIRTSIIGVGTEQGAPIPDSKGGFIKNSAGGIVIATADFNAMRSIAKAGDGLFTAMTTTDADVNKIRQIIQFDLSLPYQESEQQLEQWRDGGYWLVLLLLPFSIGAFRKGWLYGMAALALVPLPDAHAEDSLWRNNDQQAYSSYQQENFLDAQIQFDDPEWQASAAYRNEEFEAASKIWGQFVTPEAHFNRGNALARQQKFEEAIAAYDQALSLRDKFPEAAENKALIEKLMQQSEQPSSPEDNQDQDGEKSSDEQQQQTDSQGSESGSENQQGSESEQQQSESEEQSSSITNEEQLKEMEEKRQAELSEMEESEEHSDEKEQQQMAIQQMEQIEDEKSQRLQQWLRQIPDDPGGLLRRKFQIEHYRRQQENQTQKEASQTW